VCVGANLERKKFCYSINQLWSYKDDSNSLR